MANVDSGSAPIKAQYIDFDHKRKIVEEFLPKEVADELKEASVADSPKQDGDDGTREPPEKRPKLKGRNKKRPIEKNPDAKDKICPQILAERECAFGDRCRFMHDVERYLSLRPADLGDVCYNYVTYGRCPYSYACRFASQHLTEDKRNKTNEEVYERSKNVKTVLNTLDKDLQRQLWKKKYDFSRCDDICKKTKTRIEAEKSAPNSALQTQKISTSVARSISECIQKKQTQSDTNAVDSRNGATVESSPAMDSGAPTRCTAASTDNNVISDAITLSEQIREGGAVSAEIGAISAQNESISAEAGAISSEKGAISAETAVTPESCTPRASAVCGVSVDCTTSEPSDQTMDGPATVADDRCRISADILAALPRDCGKKIIDFRDKLYLAPLTTTGNLPFRRVCKGLGADITCSEMAMCQNLLQGQQSEWALLKRHASEDIFGIQLCGSYPDIMTRCSQIICENLQADFIDINCGCPIDLVFKRGEGSALMARSSRFEHIVKSMTSVMDIPLTAKIRTGIYENKSIAHTLVPCLRDWGISMTTLHGRSREQRYTRQADWDYINTCAAAASPMPLFGNGDILSYEDYEMHRERTGIAGAMVARGALIKPWIFTEIKERRHWDISASERLDMLRDFTNYGLEQWGSDQQGVTTTRRFLLEWLSFLYRYIPTGILERLPQRINQKPPHYFGRNDLETLMASPNCADWVKISEMLLGPVPDNFTFLPKHKANSYQ